MKEGHQVIVADNFFTGRRKNVEHWIGHENFELIHHDIVNPLYIEVDEIYHLASPASPTHYMRNPVKTIKTNTVGTLNMLGMYSIMLSEKNFDLRQTSSITTPFNMLYFVLFCFFFI